MHRQRSGTLEGLLAPVVDLLKSASVIHAADLPALPERVASRSMIVTKSLLTYDAGDDYSAESGKAAGYYRADVLNFLSTHEGHCALAAALSCLLLHKGSRRVTVDLAHPLSEIKVLRLQTGHADYSRVGLDVSPTALRWKLDRDAAMSALIAQSGRLKPKFLLVHEDDVAEIQQGWETRNHVELVSSELGLLLLTSALVDYGRRGVAERELACHAPPSVVGCLGVGSAEARFWLPGSIHHPEDVDIGPDGAAGPVAGGA